ncbi:MAG: alpha/beta fold hydrolase [Candidatus Melainabacteria bacterium]|nr:alpha/beta fold hydrolase [Candidatus Melainabacteria bacterium]
MPVLYLHGFASGPSSRKARFFREQFSNCQVPCVVPDLNHPSFFNMTLTSQLALVRKEADALREKFDEKLILIGSSMGGLLAAMLSDEIDFVEKMYLLAPGFGITSRWQNLIGEEGLMEWQKLNQRFFFHYATGKEEPLSWHFAEDLSSSKMASTRPEEIRIAVSTHIFHGLHDATVPFDNSKLLAESNGSTVTLTALDDGHELAESLPQIWQAISTELHLN